MELHSDGTTYWYAPTEIKSICKIDIKSFPFDEQYCPLVIGSWAYSSSQLNLENKSHTADLSKYTVSGEWDLVAVPVKRNVVKYSCCPDPYIDVTFTVHVRRKVLFYLTNLILPCVVLAVLTVFSFYLPPESGERVSLVITILLGLTVFMLVFTENVPRTSEVVPLIGKYSFTVMCEVSLSLLVTCGIVRIYHKNPNYPLPVWFRYLTFNILAPVFRMTPPNRNKDKCAHNASRHGSFDKNSTRPLSQPPYLYVTKLRQALFRRQNAAGDRAEERSLADNEECFSNVDETVTSQSFSDQKLDDILMSLCSILEHIKEVRTTDMNRSDWHFSAQVIDILFFWVFTVTMVMSSIAFALMIPRDWYPVVLFLQFYLFSGGDRNFCDSRAVLISPNSDTDCTGFRLS